MNLNNILNKTLNEIHQNKNNNHKILSHLISLRNEVERNALLLGKIQSCYVKNKKHIKSLEEAEFKVFSQFGQDGIIQYLINHIQIPNKIFIEFGVETYYESTTRFLLMNNRWKGLIIEGSEEYINFINSSNLYWAYDLTTKHAFINSENINKLITSFTKIKDVGLLVIDIDGNDYWIWKSINKIRPRIVVCEYNALFGYKKAITVPYSPIFTNSDHIHFGASLKALVKLAKTKGYVLIGCNSAGNDAFFIRKDVLGKFLKKTTIKNAYRQLFKGKPKKQIPAFINTKPLFDISKNKIIPPHSKIT